jgi:16S rRNA (cytidine1402-2'-O)-methyltransferase
LLYICPTPIGNLSDITLRVLEKLGEADVIAAEDTRRTRKLLEHYRIGTPLLSFYEHNELTRLPELIGRLRKQEKVALVSDAGMPGICDPGYRLIRAVIEEGIPYEVLPGPSAIETALVASGFATDAFVFLGYLPRKSGELRTALGRIASEPLSCVAFEAPHRLRKTLKNAEEVLPDRAIAVCRELTKKFEEVNRGTAAELGAGLPEKVKGEIVLVFAGKPAAAGEKIPEEKLTEAVSMLMQEGLSARRAAEIASGLTGAAKNRVYRLALRIKRDSS